MELRPKTTIVRATETDVHLLSVIGTQTILESHGHSASPEDMQHYVGKNMSEEAFTEELSNTDNLYYIIYSDNEPVGYAKIVLNEPNPNVAAQNVTKLGRIYILKKFLGQPFGKELFDYIQNISKQHDQAGMWLNVWIENHRAFKFYQKQGFKIVGSYDFVVSPTHSNPNHVMYLKFE